MKIAIFLLVAFSFAFASCAARNQTVAAENQIVAADKTKETTEKTPVLVELFTSEGCSSCPPAERALAFLENEQPVANAEIIALALHVDYWNRLGWTDEFASPLFSQRQELYANKFRLGSIYTPQMIVDGNAEFNGSNTGKAAKEIMKAAREKKAKIELALSGEDKLNVKISEPPAAFETATIFLAIAENNLASNVKAGENSGQTLRHTAVVRELKSVGALDSQKKSFETEIVLPFQPNWKRENLKAVVFVQENQARKIIGANQISFKE
jgi:hypothetical protein